MALDSVENEQERPEERGPSEHRRPEVADVNRLYQVSESSSVLVRAGDEVEHRLRGLPYTAAKLVDGVFVPTGKARR